MITSRKTGYVALLAGLAALLFAATAGAQASRQIGVGETLRGELATGDLSLEDGSYYDVYTFPATAGQSYIVTLTSDEFDTYLRVEGPGGLSDENDDAEDGITNSKLEFTAPVTGLVQIEATSLARRETGRYSIALQPGVANRRIAVGESAQGDLTADSPKHTDGTPYQAFIFDGKAGQSVTIDMTSKDFDAYLILRKTGSSDDLASDDDGGGGTNAQVFFTLPSTGTYEIRADAVSTSAKGHFTLKLSSGVNERKPVASAIAYGRVVRGELKTGGGRDATGLFYDVYSFVGTKGDKVTISAVSSDFDPVLYLGVSGQEEHWLDSNDDEPGGGTDALIQYVLPADGTYDVHVVSYNQGEAGHYTMGLSVER